jgi:hypothetical protein
MICKDEEHTLDLLHKCFFSPSTKDESRDCHLAHSSNEPLAYIWSFF